MMIEDVIITPLDIIDVPGGDVFHAIKDNEIGYSGIGEVYFSCIESGYIKAWKRHNIMTLNIVVPVGEIRFVLFDDRNINVNPVFQDVILSRKNYCRLTVPPGIWMGFQGISKEDSLLLNVASIKHDPDEVDKREINEITFDWSIEI